MERLEAALRKAGYVPISIRRIRLQEKDLFDDRPTRGG